MKKLIILRGLPGSGKSKVAEEMKSMGAFVYSTDDFFMKDGQYVFDPARLPEAHTNCQQRVLTALSTEAPLVVVDNTHSRFWEFCLCAQMGAVFGYDVEVRTIGGRSYEDVRKYAQRSMHKVPELAILKMAYRWEE